MGRNEVGVSLVTSLVVVILTCKVAAQKNATEASGSPSWTAGKIPFFEDQDAITVCGSPWTSAVACEIDAKEDQWVSASGYEVEVFKLAMPIVGWTDEMIKFECLGWGDMMDRLENGTCDIAPSGMAPLTERMELGLKFSDHTLQSGIAVMVRAEDENTRTIWYFFSAMSWEVWVALLATAFVAGGIVWLMEVGSKALNKETRYLKNVMWDTVGRPVQMRDYRVASIAGNMVAWVWSFTAFIVMALFQASLTTNMTIQSINGKLTSFDDLQGRTVGTWGEYADYLRPFGAKLVSYPWDGPDDEQIMMDALVSGEISALVLDETALRNLDGNNCSTRIVEAIQPIKVTGQTAGFGVRPDADRVITAYNVALRALMENDQLQELRDQFIYVEHAVCKDTTVSTDYTQVQWQDVAGLWIILGISVAVALLVVAFYRAWHHSLQRRNFFRKTRSISQGMSRSLTLMADKNMSSSELTDAMDPLGSEMLYDDQYAGASNGYIDGTQCPPTKHKMEEEEDLQTLVRHMRSELKQVKELLLEREVHR